ncbi:Mur ligase family protein, partial [Enterococcus faecalis]|nr:Mur ligase family protein [Enterococcus faecalis]
RIGALDFDGGIFTNLTRDQLDYHGSVPEYLRAKKRFFDGLGAQAFALVNADDKNGLVMVQNTRARVCTYALKSMANYR